MDSDEGHLSPSGVWIAKDFRKNLIIDRHDPVFADMRASKIKHLRSANSEDAVTWNVFRSLGQIEPSAWLPRLWQQAFPKIQCPTDLRAVVKLWESAPPPLGLLAGGDEGSSEIDVVIETPTWVWFIEAKLRSDISTGTTTRPNRDQVLRNIDVGSYRAGVREFFFTLLISSKERSPEGCKRIRRYEDTQILQEELREHRPDGLQNLKSVGLLTWAQLGDVLFEAANTASREDEKAYATRAVAWLKERGLFSR
jgi:hypothetical protein